MFEISGIPPNYDISEISVPSKWPKKSGENKFALMDPENVSEVRTYKYSILALRTYKPYGTGRCGQVNAV